MKCKARKLISIALSAALVMTTVFVPNIRSEAAAGGIAKGSVDRGTYGEDETINYFYYKSLDGDDSFLILDGEGTMPDVSSEGYEYTTEDGSGHPQYDMQGWYGAWLSDDEETIANYSEDDWLYASSEMDVNEIIVAGKIPNIGKYTFGAVCMLEETVRLGKSVSCISQWAFAYDSLVKNVYIYGEVTEIDESAFEGVDAHFHVASQVTATALENAGISSNDISIDLTVDDTPLRIALKKGAIEQNKDPEGVGFTIVSWNAFDKAMTDGQDLLADIEDGNDITEDEVNEKAAAIDTAIDGLTPITLENAKSELNALLEDVQDLVQSDYTEKSWAALQSALNDAEDVKDSDSVIEVGSAGKKLLAAIDSLIVDEYWYALAGIPYSLGGSKKVSILSGTVDPEMAGAVKVEVTFDCALDTAFNSNSGIFLAMGGDEQETTGEDSTAKNGQTGCKADLELTAPLQEGAMYNLLGYTGSWEKAAGYVYVIQSVKFLDNTGNVLKSVDAPEGIEDMLSSALAVAESDAENITAGDYTEDSIKAMNAYIAKVKAMENVASLLPSEVKEILANLENITSMLEPLITPSPIPSASPTPTPSASPTPTPTPSASPTPTPSESPTPSAAPTSTAKPTSQPNATQAPGTNATPTPAPAKKGVQLTSGNFVYKVTKAATAKTAGTLTVTALSKAGKKASKLSVSATATINGYKYKVTKLGNNALKGAAAKNVTLSKSITAIPKGAFANCKKLTTLTVKAKLKSVKKGAFKGCKKKITVKGSTKKTRKSNLTKLKKSGYKKFK